MPAAAPTWLAAHLGRVVIADLDGCYLAIGTLQAADDAAMTLVDADLHDHTEANCTKDVYALESRSLGVRVNRQRVTVPLGRVIAIGLLEDVAP